ncbi:uncharacterized protein LOC116344298 [Contarinia nasturtii]|uniref:uncharacterized protein LOC116344298 n=1 Tax=Contarinia nasturtii TaxID=265458 RepID=UPI0012D4C1DD|nr:uncharacterized protein LOC116344298 [Contarinia nasturtii]
MFVKAISLCLLMAHLLGQSSAATKLIGAKSIDILWNEQSFLTFWDGITNFLLKNTISDPHFRSTPTKHEIVNRLEKQINEGNYNFDYTDRHEVWIVFENFMKNLQNPIVPESTAKIVKQCDDFDKVGPGLEALSKLSEKAKKFIVLLCKFLRRVYLMKNIAFGAEMDAWLTPKKENFLRKALCLENESGKLDKIQTIFIYDEMSKSFGDVINYMNQHFYVIKLPGVESTCKIFHNTNVARCWNSKPLQDFLQKSLTFMRENCLTLEGFFKKDAKVSDKNALQRQIENGFNDFTQIKNKHLLVQIFKRFLTGFKEPIIPNDIAVIIRNISEDQILQKLNAVLDVLNELPNANKILIDKVLRLMRDAANVASNDMDASALAIRVDQCFSFPTTLTGIINVKRQEKPMMAHLIANWGDHIHLDDYLDFVQRK